MSRTISFRAANRDEAAKRLEEAFNADVSADQRVDQRIADAVAGVLEVMPEGRQVAVSVELTVHTDEAPSSDGKDRISVKVGTVTDRESGVASRYSGASKDDLSLSVSSSSDPADRMRGAATRPASEGGGQVNAAPGSQPEGNREGGNNAGAQGGATPSTPGVRPGDPVS